jgi:hypothetical protein
MTEIIVLGQPFWALRIASALDRSAPGVRARFVPHARYPALLLTPRRGEDTIIIRAGYRVGASTPRGRAFDAWTMLLRRTLPRARWCHYWLGTDVLDTLEDGAHDRLDSRAWRSAEHDLHVCDAPWLATELATVGLRARSATVPTTYCSPDDVSPLPDDFSVLTYLPGARFAFYGGDLVFDVAERLPEVPFHVLGAQDGLTRPVPANVTYHGWVSDPLPHYARASVVVRVPRHDGMGATVIEGLLSARHVVYTHQLPFVKLLDPVDASGLESALVGLRDEHAAGRLAPNLAGREFARTEFGAETLTRRLGDILLGRA